MLEKVIEMLDQHCKECPVGQAMHVLMDSVTNFEVAEPIKPEPTRSKPVKAAATKPDRNRTEKPCKKCQVVKPLEQYPPNKGCRDGHEGTCMECKRAYARAMWHKRQKAKKQATAPAPNPDGKHPCRFPGCDSAFRSLDTLAEHMKLRHGA